jgi:hypothetical protein
VQIGALKEHISIIAGDDVDEVLSEDQFAHIVKRALREYSKWQPDTKEILVNIPPDAVGSLVYAGTYHFPKPYPKVATATPVDPALSVFMGVAVPAYTYDPEHGILRVPSAGFYAVRVSVTLTLESLEDDDHPLFFDILVAMYKMVVGGWRKRHQLQEMPFQTDASEMYQEGKDELDYLQQNTLPDNMPWWIGLTEK